MRRQARKHENTKAEVANSSKHVVVKTLWILAVVAIAGPGSSAQSPAQQGFRDVFQLAGLGIVGAEIAGETSCQPNASGIREVTLLKSIDGPRAATLEWRRGIEGSCELFLIRDAERQRLYRGWDLPEVSYESAAVAYYEHIDGFVRVFERTVSSGLWMRISDMPGGRLRRWSELLVASPHTYLGYDGLRLHEQPSAGSRVLVALRERKVHDVRVHQLIPTGEVSGDWGKFDVIEFNSDFYLLARAPDAAPTGNAWQGWLRLVNDAGAPAFWFFTRD